MSEKKDRKHCGDCEKLKPCWWPTLVDLPEADKLSELEKRANIVACYVFEPKK